MFKKDDKDDDDKVKAKDKEKDKALVISIPTAPALQLSDPQHNWWDIFCAAAQGMWANPTYATQGRDYIYEQATLFAVRAVGEYPPDPPPEL